MDKDKSQKIFRFCLAAFIVLSFHTQFSIAQSLDLDRKLGEQGAKDVHIAQENWLQKIEILKF